MTRRRSSPPNPAEPDLAERAAAAITGRLPGWTPRVAIVLGSGLDGVAETIEQAVSIPYGELPGFPPVGIEGHAGRAVAGTLAGVAVLCLCGRAHAYEGVPPAAFRVPVRTAKRLGAEILLLTNAAGSLRAELGPGRLLLIADHINLLGINPLTGPNDAAYGPRFPDLTEAYDPALRDGLRAAAERLGLPLAEGVYLAYPGPSFETPAEIRAFQRLGADAVGMSTVPETIVARHCGLRVAGVSVITNLAAGLGATAPSHEETLAVAGRAARDLARLVTAFLAALL